MEPSDTNKCAHKVNVHQSSAAGLAWFAGWLFTIGYLHLDFWKAALSLLIWPYFIGTHCGMLPR